MKEAMTNSGEHPLQRADWWNDDDLDGLSEHIQDKLAAAGFTSVEQLKAAGKKAIRDVPGIGKVAFNEIKEWLKTQP